MVMRVKKERLILVYFVILSNRVTEKLKTTLCQNCNGFNVAHVNPPYIKHYNDAKRENLSMGVMLYSTNQHILP